MNLVSAPIEHPTRIGSDLGSTLRERRRAVGMSAVQVATEVGVRLSQLREWERGDAVPAPALVRALARLLDLEATTAREWLDLAGAGGVESPDVEIVLLGGNAPADPFAEPAVIVDLTRQPSRWEAARPSAGVPGAAVFPAPGSGPYVYSAGDLEFPSRARPMTRRRWLVMAAVVVALGLVLWWAFGELGHGLSSVVERLDAPPG